ncbi:MAG: ParB N-terminal domain-containing protein [Acidobacteriota bacterium]|nr:ParB N-terminal domain-containing protein [Acidobacteriota bacterium]
MELRRINLGDIKLENRRYKFTLDEPSRKLLTSIRESGITEPVKVKTEEGGYILASGWKRVAAALAAGLKEIPAQIFPGGLTDLNIFKLVFFENYPQEDFSLAEKALIIKKFLEFGLKSEKLIREFLPGLELPPERQTIDVLNRLSDLDWALPEVHRGRWKLATARLFLAFPPEGQRLIINLAGAFNHNQQAEFIDLLFTLQQRQEKEITAILAEREIEPLVQEIRGKKPQAGDRLMTVLRERVNPLVNQINREIRQKIKQIDLPEKCCLSYDKSLEKTFVSLNLMAGTEEELVAAVSHLSNSLKTDQWSSLFRLLGK